MPMMAEVLVGWDQGAYTVRLAVWNADTHCLETPTYLCEIDRPLDRDPEDDEIPRWAWEALQELASQVQKDAAAAGFPVRSRTPEKTPSRRSPRRTYI